MNRHTRKILLEKDVSLQTFATAVLQAQAEFRDLPMETGERMELIAALCYQPGGKICDVGGNASPYQMILRKLGMQVTAVDFFPEFNQGSYLFDPVIARKIRILKNDGIAVINADAFSMKLEPGAYDVVTSFECFEHFPQSPKPVIEEMIRALAPGGLLILSVPNIARISTRLRLLAGKTPLEKYPSYYHHGNPFLGHHREMTLREVNWLVTENRLQPVQVFATDITVQSRKRRSWLKQQLSRLNYRFGLTELLLPDTLRKHIYAIARKPAN